MITRSRKSAPRSESAPRAGEVEMDVPVTPVLSLCLCQQYKPSDTSAATDVALWFSGCVGNQGSNWRLLASYFLIFVKMEGVNDVELRASRIGLALRQRLHVGTVWWLRWDCFLTGGPYGLPYLQASSTTMTYWQGTAWVNLFPKQHSVFFCEHTRGVWVDTFQAEAIQADTSFYNTVAPQSFSSFVQAMPAPYGHPTISDLENLVSGMGLWQRLTERSRVTLGPRTHTPRPPRLTGEREPEAQRGKENPSSLPDDARVALSRLVCLLRTRPRLLWQLELKTVSCSLLVTRSLSFTTPRRTSTLAVFRSSFPQCKPTKVNAKTAQR